MRGRETSLRFGENGGLIGVVHEPGLPPVGGYSPAVIMLNSGIIHRVGPGRLYVRLARRLAERGLLVLRFDLSGVGDSAPRADNVPFEQSSQRETRQAMDLLHEAHGVREFLLLGICTGAVVAYRTAVADERVTGAVLINGQGFVPEASLARRYVTERKDSKYVLERAIYDPKSWLRLLVGRADYRGAWRALAGRLTRRADAPLPAEPETELLARGLRGLTARGTRLLLLYSEADPGVDELDVILGAERDAFLADERVAYAVIEQTDHMFTALGKQEAFLRSTERWLLERAGRRARPAPDGAASAATGALDGR